jgi:hypothetical protein
MYNDPQTIVLINFHRVHAVVIYVYNLHWPHVVIHSAFNSFFLLLLCYPVLVNFFDN